jgi:hypothetical protein
MRTAGASRRAQPELTASRAEDAGPGRLNVTLIEAEKYVKLLSEMDGA